jgi:hypothetical protein
MGITLAPMAEWRLYKMAHCDCEIRLSESFGTGCFRGPCASAMAASSFFDDMEPSRRVSSDRTLAGSVSKTLRRLR